ncbi:hypothetical protein CRENPOLYSF2_370022 [Crenothrix polyspora]|uniref:Uncharacterized protein n=1 Tax=Crenothrix polyspora TaxID=360316 RepID=A0A1R4HCI0_9GAMM|nr:hypothetical protein CRENPOLYSF2_370022 [Crenothrix polyspora]
MFNHLFHTAKAISGKQHTFVIRLIVHERHENKAITQFFNVCSFVCFVLFVDK